MGVFEAILSGMAGGVVVLLGQGLAARSPSCPLAPPLDWPHWQGLFTNEHMGVVSAKMTEAKVLLGLIEVVGLLYIDFWLLMGILWIAGETGKWRDQAVVLPLFILCNLFGYLTLPYLLFQ